jgi:hypothetical protein
LASILQQHALTTPGGASGLVAHDQDKPPLAKPGEQGRTPVFRRAGF